MTSAGLRAKFSPPLLPIPWRTWAFLGAGYARTYAPSYQDPSGFVPGMGGGILVLPVGLGLGYRTSRTWEVVAELGGQFGLAFTGSMYDPDASSRCACGAPFGGKDSVALSLSLGLSLNE
jgi:hypothetical protein